MGEAETGEEAKTENRCIDKEKLFSPFDPYSREQQRESLTLRKLAGLSAPFNSGMRHSTSYTR